MTWKISFVFCSHHPNHYRHWFKKRENKREDQHDVILHHSTLNYFPFFSNQASNSLYVSKPIKRTTTKLVINLCLSVKYTFNILVLLKIILKKHPIAVVNESINIGFTNTGCKSNRRFIDSYFLFTKTLNAKLWTSLVSVIWSKIASQTDVLEIVIATAPGCQSLTHHANTLKIHTIPLIYSEKWDLIPLQALQNILGSIFS